MKRRQWTAKDKLTIVLQGFKGEISSPSSAISIRSARVSTTNGATACWPKGPESLEYGGPDRAELRLQKEVRTANKRDGHGQCASASGMISKVPDRHIKEVARAR